MCEKTPNSRLKIARSWLAPKHQAAIKVEQKTTCHFGKNSKPNLSLIFSASMQYELFCEKEIIGAFVHSLLFISFFFCAPLSGYLSDNYGRWVIISDIWEFVLNVALNEFIFGHGALLLSQVINFYRITLL